MSSQATQTLPSCPLMATQSIQTTPITEPVPLLSQSVQTTPIPSPISTTPTPLPEMDTQSPVPFETEITPLPQSTDIQETTPIPNPELSEMVRIPVAPDLPEASPLPSIQVPSPVPGELSSNPENQTPIPQPSTQTGAAQPIEFKEIFKQMALDGLVQNVKYEPTDHPQKDLKRFLEAHRSTINPLLQQALESKHGLPFGCPSK